ncbi:unnamed protein product, partial [marine sediment metagenome]
NGTAQSITACLEGSAYVAHRIKCALYNNVSIIPGIGMTADLLKATPEQNIIWDVKQWRTFNFTAPKPILIAATPYFICAYGDESGLELACTIEPGWDDTSFHTDIDPYNAFPDPISTDVAPSEVHSIYCSYSVPAVPPANPLIGKPLIGADIIQKAKIR